MKIINTLLCSFLILISLQINASVLRNSNENLVDRMAQDNNVRLLFKNGLKAKTFTSVVRKEDYLKLSEEAKSEISTNLGTINATRIQLLKVIYTDYPELNQMNISERQEVFRNILQSKQLNLSVATFLKCLGGAIGTVATCANIANGVRKWAFGACTAAAITTDLAVQSSDPPAFALMIESGVEQQLVQDEVIACADIFSSVTWKELGQCGGVFLVTIGACVDAI